MLLDRYQVPSSAPGKNATPDQFRKYCRKNDLSQIPSTVHAVSMGRLFDVRRDGVDSCYDPESRRPSHGGKDQDDRRNFLVEHWGISPSPQDYQEHHRYYSENRNRLEYVEQRQEHVRGTMTHRCCDSI